MDNIDWTVKEDEAEKVFYLSDKNYVDIFISKIRKLSRKEEHKIRLRKISNHEVRVRMPVLEPGNYSEKEVIILNMINKLAI